MSDILFLPESEYGFLTDDSMIPINKDLETLEVTYLNELKKNGWGSYSDTLRVEDIKKLVTLIQTSAYVSKPKLRDVNRTSTSKIKDLLA